MNHMMMAQPVENEIAEVHTLQVWRLAVQSAKQIRIPIVKIANPDVL